MTEKKLWEFPVPSNCINNGVTLTLKKSNLLLKFDFYDEEKEDKIFNGGILFKTALLHRHSSEKFTKKIGNTYDTLIEYEKSEWLNELYLSNSEYAEFWNIRHFAIYLDSYGLYEVIAEDYKIFDIKEGENEDENV